MTLSSADQGESGAAPSPCLSGVLGTAEAQGMYINTLLSHDPPVVGSETCWAFSNQGQDSPLSPMLFSSSGFSALAYLALIATASVAAPSLSERKDKDKPKDDG